MLPVLLAIAVIAVLAFAASLLVGRPRHDDEVERFHRARQMTTEWSRARSPRPTAGIDADDAAVDLNAPLANRSVRAVGREPADA